MVLCTTVETAFRETPSSTLVYKSPLLDTTTPASALL
jgi:hypothetical protein